MRQINNFHRREAVDHATVLIDSANDTGDRRYMGLTLLLNHLSDELYLMGLWELTIRHIVRLGKAIKRAKT